MWEIASPFTKKAELQNQKSKKVLQFGSFSENSWMGFDVRHDAIESRLKIGRPKQCALHTGVINVLRDCPLATHKSHRLSFGLRLEPVFMLLTLRPPNCQVLFAQSRTSR
jgi:hypothetical protein